MSKKSLDDYYYQLRLGQKFGFDFNKNLHEGIGMLRKYTCNFKPKGRKNGVNQRYEKNLKCFDLVTQQKRANFKKISQFGSSQTEKRGSIKEVGLKMVKLQANNLSIDSHIDQESALNPFGQMQEDSPQNLEEKFYHQFHYEPEEQKDPFFKNHEFKSSFPSSGRVQNANKKP